MMSNRTVQHNTLYSRLDIVFEQIAKPCTSIHCHHALTFVSTTYLFALLSKRRLSRFKTWFALMISSLVYCISFLLLVGHQTGPEPPFGLCLFQAGLIYAAPPGVAAAGLAFVVELFLRLTTTMDNRQLDLRIITGLLFLPPLAHQIVFWIAMSTGLSNRNMIQREPHQMFCDFAGKLPTTVTGSVTGALTVIIIMIELYTIYYFWRKRHIFGDLRRRYQSGPIFPFALFVRVGFFTIAGGLAILLVYQLNAPSSSSSDTGTLTDLLAIIPLLIAIVFGTQEQDLVQMYKFWKKRGSPKDTFDPATDG
ncbi:hypothetical protein FB446DRAFT_532019 [Lentinula raphanica]|nr:hypothetical protein FB446DRAFT_532019 [Lentinula raphanica]